MLKDKGFIIFVLAGGIAALINFTSRWVLNYYLSYSWSIIIAYLIGMISAFVLMKKFVFQPTKLSVSNSAMKFVIVNLAAILQTWLISLIFAYYIFPWLAIDKYAKELAHAIGICVPIFTSYVGHKNWTFK